MIYNINILVKNIFFGYLLVFKILYLMDFSDSGLLLEDSILLFHKMDFFGYQTCN